MTTLNLVPRLLKMLSHLATSYHPFSHFSKSNFSDNFEFSTRTALKVIRKCGVEL